MDNWRRNYWIKNHWTENHWIRDHTSNKPKGFFRSAGLLALLMMVACAGPQSSAPNPNPAQPPGSGDGDGIEVALNADTVQGEVPLVVSFSANATGTGEDTLYTWEFGDGEPSAGSLSRLHVYTEPGLYTAKVLAQGDAGGKSAEVPIEALESTIPRNISNKPPTVTLVATVVDPLKPDTVTFLAAGQDTPDDTLSYLLDFGDGDRTTQASAEHVYDAPGTYLATVVARDTHNTLAVTEAEVVVREASSSATSAE